MSIMWTIAEHALRSQMAAAAPAAIPVPPRFGLYAAAALLCLAGMAFALAALYMGLAEQFSPALAALGTAGGAFATAGLMIGVAHLWRHPHQQQKRIDQTTPDNMESITETIQMIAEELEEPVKAYPKTAMALAALAGLAAGSRIN